MTSSRFRKFLNASDIEHVIDVVAVNNKGRNIALAGGAAMQWYGSDRLTKDVDFLADYIPEVLQTTGLISFGGKKGTIDGTVVDVIIRDDDYAALYEAALYHARIDPELGSIKILSPEYLAAIKLSAGRPKDEEDLIALINSGELNLIEARRVIKNHLGAYAVNSFNSFEHEAVWRKSQEEP